MSLRRTPGLSIVKLAFDWEENKHYRLRYRGVDAANGLSLTSQDHSAPWKSITRLKLDISDDDKSRRIRNRTMKFENPPFDETRDHKEELCNEQ